MEIVGLERVDVHDRATVERCAEVMGSAFLEEGWTALVLGALDGHGESSAEATGYGPDGGRGEGSSVVELKRRRCIRLFRDEFAGMSAQGNLWATPDLCGVMEVYASTEMDAAGIDVDAPYDAAMERFIGLLDAPAAQALRQRMRAIGPISDYSWYPDVCPDGYIDLMNIAIAPERRGRGMLRMMLEALFTAGDALALPVVLECFSDRLVGIYAHHGFEEVRTLSAPGFVEREHCMVRWPS